MIRPYFTSRGPRLGRHLRTWFTVTPRGLSGGIRTRRGRIVQTTSGRGRARIWRWFGVRW